MGFILVARWVLCTGLQHSQLLLPCCDGCCEGKEYSWCFGVTDGRGQALLKYVQQVSVLAYGCCRLSFSDANDLGHLSQAASAFL